MLSEPTGGLCSVQTNTGPPEYRKWRRGHGLQLPLHPQQVVGWIALGFSAATCFLVLVPALAVHLQPALLTIFSILYLFHCISHITALLLDPADPALRRLKAATKQPVPEFDRTKHAHVIENGRCHLCNIQTSSPRTKHCSVCNKCVGKFDHHCKWLNHCIGGRNYASFLMCVTSAVVTAIAVLLVCLGEIIVYYVNPQWLSQWIDPALQHSNTSASATTTATTTNPPAGASTSTTPTSQSSDAAFLVIVGALGILAAITAGLLLHLCFFHVYISFLGLTTYEYIRAYRPNLMSTAPPPSEPSLPPNTVRHRPSTLHCCDRTGNVVSPDNARSNVTFYACAIVENNKCRPPRTNGFACCSATRRRPNHLSDASYRNDPSIHTDIGGMVPGGGGSDEGVLKYNQSSPAPMDECKCCGIITVTSSSSTTTESASDVSGISGTSATSFKSPLKKQRFHGKWNCCSAVPDSPDDSRYMNTNHECVLSLCKFKSKPKTNTISAGNLDPPVAPAASRPPPVEWYGARRPSRAALRIRLLFRVLSNLRTRRRNNQPTNHLNPNQYRNNQVVPLAERNGSATEQQPQTILGGGPVLLPPLPAAPLSSRRRLINGAGLLTDMSSTTTATATTTAAPDLLLVDSLSTISAQSIGSIRRYRRRHRRHTVLHNRPKSPTLSPIHESGLSNPASPVPCRHSVCSGDASTLINSAGVANGSGGGGGGGGVLESCLNGGLVPSTHDSLEYTSEQDTQFRHVR